MLLLLDADALDVQTHCQLNLKFSYATESILSIDPDLASLPENYTPHMAISSN